MATSMVTQESLETRASDPLIAEVVGVYEHHVTLRTRICFGAMSVLVQYPRTAFTWGEGESPLYFKGGAAPTWARIDPDRVASFVNIPLAEEDTIKFLLAKKS